MSLGAVEIREVGARLQMAPPSHALSGVCGSCGTTNTGGGAYPVPLWSLRAFTRVRVPAGASTNVTLAVADFTVVDAAGEAPTALGIWALTVGGQQPGQTGQGHSCGQAPLTTTVTVTAAPLGGAAVTE